MCFLPSRRVDAMTAAALPRQPAQLPPHRLAYVFHSLSAVQGLLPALGARFRLCSAAAHPSSLHGPAPCLWAVLASTRPRSCHLPTRSSALWDGVRFLPHSTALPAPVHRWDSVSCHLPAACPTPPQHPRIAFLEWGRLGATGICSQICLGAWEPCGGRCARPLSVSPGLSPWPGCQTDLIQVTEGVGGRGSHLISVTA